MKKTLIILLIILAVATGAYFIFKKKQCTDCSNKEKEEEEKIEPVNTGTGNTQQTPRDIGEHIRADIDAVAQYEPAPQSRLTIT